MRHERREYDLDRGCPKVSKGVQIHGRVGEGGGCPLNRRLSMVRVLTRTSWRARAPRRPLPTGFDASVAVDGAAKTARFSFDISTVHPRCDACHLPSPPS